MIIVKSRRSGLNKILRDYPGAVIIDVTSKASDEYVRFSPFFPHGGIPVPFSPGWTAQSVEGIWQGLKVFGEHGIDTSSFLNDTMTGIKRSERRYGKVLGHKKGVFWSPNDLLGYTEARHSIYAPAYLWVLQNKVPDLVDRIRTLANQGTVVLLDYNTNEDIDNTSRPLSHAGLVKAYIEECYPLTAPHWQDMPTQENYLPGQWIHHATFGAGEIISLKDYHARVRYADREAEIDLYSDKFSHIDLSRTFTYGILVLKKDADADELEVVGCARRYLSNVAIPQELTINGKNYPVTHIGNGAFVNMIKLRDLVIPPSVNKIEPDAFDGSEYIKQVQKQTSGKEEVTVVRNAGGLCGVLEKPSRKLAAIPFEYEEIRFYAAVENAKQRVPKYYFIVRKDGKWGILNKQGNAWVPCVYDSITPQEERGFFTGFYKFT